MSVFIVSGLEIEKSDVKELTAKVEVAEGEKCERCWKYDVTVGKDEKHPSICHKCSEAIN